MTLITRDVRNVAWTGVTCLNPFERQPCCAVRQVVARSRACNEWRNHFKKRVELPLRRCELCVVHRLGARSNQLHKQGDVCVSLVR